MNKTAAHELPLACDLTALSAEQRTLRLSQANLALVTGRARVQELANGYAFRFAADDYHQYKAQFTNAVMLAGNFQS